MRIEVDAKKWRAIPDLRELLGYGDLFVTLAYRDIRVRYAQTALGLLWAFFQPLATLVVMTLIFGRAAAEDPRMRAALGHTPYPLFSIIGISAWSYFAFVLKESGNSVIGAQEIVRKIYFPRLIIPLSKATVGLVDLLVALLVVAFLFIHYRVMPSSSAWLAAVYLLGIMMAALAIGIWVSALTIRFRDLQHVVPFVIQFGLFATPVAYPVKYVTATLPQWAQVLYYLNPMTGLIEGFRWCLLGIGDPGGYCWISFLSATVLFLTSFMYFRSMERIVADLI